MSHFEDVPREPNDIERYRAFVDPQIMHIQADFDEALPGLLELGDEDLMRKFVFRFMARCWMQAIIDFQKNPQIVDELLEAVGELDPDET